ncbi:MAG: tetratricopeptide repeat protein [Chitinophagaceae bacterium]|nr:tetratricopeptide repeat protein [Chitinophagaceae bacterium]
MAYLYFEVKDYEKAERLQIETNDGLKVLYGDTSSKYLQNVNDLALLYKETGQYDKLITVRAELMELYRMKFGEYSIEYLGEMLKLARHYVKGEDFSNAEPLLLRGLELGKKILGEDNKDYAIDLNYVAVQYYKQGEYSKAETLYIQSLEATKSALGEDDPSYTATLGNLALVYVNTGQYEKAEPLFVLAIRNYKKFNEKEKEDLNYPALLGNLASLYERMGQTQKAEPLYLEALQIRKSMNVEDEDYANGLFNLAGLYKNLGLNEKAEIMYRQSLEVTKTLLGDKSAAYGKAINTVALFYKTIGRYNEAKTLFYTSLEILKATIGDQHVDYATALHNFAMLYTDLKEYDQAESYYLRAGAIWKKSLGENHPFYAQLENNLSLLYLAQRDYKKAESLLLKNVEKRKKILGELHPDYAVSLNNLALLYWSLGDFKKAEKFLTQSGEIDKQYLLNVASVLSENEKNQLLANNVVLNEERNSFIYNYPMSSPAFYKENYNFQLLIKSFSLSAGQKVLTELRQTQDTAIQRIFLQWQNVKKQLASQYSLFEEDRTEDIESLQAETESLEKQLYRQSAGFRKLNATFQLSTTEVQRNIETDEIAIEFVSFDLFSKTWTDSTIYGAYILKKNDSVPFFVPLCEEKQLQKLFDSAGTTATAIVNKFYRGLEVKNKNAAGALGTELYKLIWQPLEPYLKNVKKISYSPAGKLYSIAFHALPVDSATVLMDKYQLQQYTSTRQVVLREQENQNSKPQNITLFGDAAFTLDSLQIVKGKTKTENISSNIYTPQNRGIRGGTWSSLPGTAQEVKTIQQLFDKK